MDTNSSPITADVSVVDSAGSRGIPISASVMTSLGGGGKKSSPKKDCIVVPANLLDMPD